MIISAPGDQFTIEHPGADSREHGFGHSRGIYLVFAIGHLPLNELKLLGVELH